MSPGHDEFSTTEILESGPPRRRRLPRSVLFTAVAAITVTAGAGVAAATTTDTPEPGTPTPTATATGAPAPSESQSPAPSESPSAGPDRDGRSRWRDGRGSRWFRPFGGGIHGEFTVPGAQEGQWRTVAVQVGEVTAVGQDSVTVRSADGYTREYAVTSETRINGDQGIGAIQVGHQVAVTAEVEGGTATARAILDRDLRPSRGYRHYRRGPHWHGRDNDQPHSSPSSPSATPSATTTA